MPKRIITAKSATHIFVFETVAEAAEWFRKHELAVTAGKLAAASTIKANISHGLKQPNLYPLVYGYTWKEEIYD